ncbi:nucleotide-binding oligomerization domain-containing protein 2-like [Branchiostoma lanceolatum]|uniref:nucleotide-binding oligomerization domain-containing protein 2-like n=1 Tax=Branchiostoma lanceolatum TaxID=7740 RepID=UPI003451BAEB
MALSKPSSSDPVYTPGTDPVYTPGTDPVYTPGTDPLYTPGTDPVYTPGTARGAKLAALLVDEGTSLVRNILEKEVLKMNPPSLCEQLKKHKRYLYHGQLFKKQGKNHRVNLNRGQKDTLYPAVPDTAQGFDISLLELLLKELVWLELGRDAPYSSERDRLRRFRNNNYGHISSTDLSEGDFDSLWKELTEILVALGGDRNKISERLNSSIDPEQEAEYFGLLERLYREDMELKHVLGNLEKGQVGLNEKQDRMDKKQDRILDHLLSNQSPGASTRPSAESSCQTDQVHSGSSDLTDSVIASLTDLYATECAHVRPLPWCEDLNLQLGEVYTNLQLQCRDDKGHFQDTDTIVSLADIYNAHEDEDSHVDVRTAVRKLRVEGDPGAGKSCSCQKLAYDWSCGKLDRFKIVIFLEMRHLAGKVKDDIFEQLLPKDIKVTPDQLWSYIQENQDDVLFILDGLDELSQTARDVTDVVDLIQGKILRNCHALVTSRPYHCVKDLEKCHQFYKIVGYSKENSEEFIHKYFCESPESASKLVEQLKNNSNLSAIAVNPLNNVLICVVWEDNNNELPSSKADLYEMIVLSVAKRFCTKRAFPTEGIKLPSTIQDALRGLGKLSWEGLEQEQLQFNIDEITKKYDTNADIMLNMGLLTRDYSFSRIKRTSYCAFLHKTFQEYMAARYINGLVIDGSSREEGMKCVRRLFGMLPGNTVVNRELIKSCFSEYREVQNCLLLLLGENSRPLFEMFAEDLNNAQTDEDREFLSFFCIMWLGTTCVGAKMADVVAPCLSDHVTNDHPDFGPIGTMNGLYSEVFERCRRCSTEGACGRLSCPGWRDDFEVQPEDHANWCVGLAHVLTSQKKFSVSHGASFIRHLEINCDDLCGEQDEKLVDHKGRSSKVM